MSYSSITYEAFGQELVKIAEEIEPQVNKAMVGQMLRNAAVGGLGMGLGIAGAGLLDYTVTGKLLPKLTPNARKILYPTLAALGAGAAIARSQMMARANRLQDEASINQIKRERGIE